MFDKLIRKGNANENNIEVSPHSVRMTIIKKTNNRNAYKDLRKKGTVIQSW
jgi:hypothetical protein